MVSEGLKVTFLLRLTPLIPFNVFNYVMGLTKVTLLSFNLASFGMLPGTIVYVFIGTTVANIKDVASGDYGNGTITLVFLIVGTVFACAGIIYISIVVKKYLDK